MAAVTVPAVDANVCSGWNVQDMAIYNALPFYLQKMTQMYRPFYQRFGALMGDLKWTANMGDTMKLVNKEPSPVLRQTAFPQRLYNVAKKDILDHRERTVTTEVLHQKFESLPMNFKPQFRDFLTDTVQFQSKDISQKITLYEELFYRTQIFYKSPNVFLPNKGDGEVVAAGTVVDTAPGANPITSANTSKNTGWVQAMLPLIGQPGNLSINAINLAVTIMETDLGIYPFEGSAKPGGPDQGLQDKFVLICSNEAFNQFIYDPWLLMHKSIDLDVVTKGFKGSLFGRVTCMLEKQPWRIAADGSFPAPEARVLGPAENAGESVPNPDYVNAPFEIAWVYGGGTPYAALEVGPPPSVWTSLNMPKNYAALNWNGEVRMTNNLLTQCLDDNNVLQWDTNKYGEFIQLISYLTLGIAGQQTRAVMPIIFRRKRGAHDLIQTL